MDSLLRFVGGVVVTGLVAFGLCKAIDVGTDAYDKWQDMVDEHRAMADIVLKEV